MTSKTEKITRTMAKLKELDSLIDFSRATIQLDIVLALRNSEEGISSEALASALGQRRKAVLDALRKLEYKGLVERDEDGLYHLTELGLRFLNELENLMNKNATYKGSKGVLSVKPSIKEFVLRLMLNSILYDIIMIVGSSRNHMISAKKLSKILGLSISRIDNYIEYLNSTLKTTVVRKVKIKKLFFRKEEYYKLTRQGERVYRSLLAHPRHRKFLKKITSKILGAHHVSLILKRLTIVNSIALLAIVILHILAPGLYILLKVAVALALITINLLLYLR